MKSFMMGTAHQILLELSNEAEIDASCGQLHAAVAILRVPIQRDAYGSKFDLGAVVK
jgi:hypothetical protein